MQTLNLDHICIQTIEICNSGTRRLGREEQPDAEEDHGEVRGEDRGVNGQHVAGHGGDVGDGHP